jgi:cytochrome oxidase Cu insertion factor (SCO1/SenC/PrrC family)
MAAEVIMNKPWTRWLVGSVAALSLASSACSRNESKPQPEQAQTPEKTPEQTPKPTGEQSSLLAVGAGAPDFTAEAHDGTTVSMKALEGQPVVLYFYPKDATPG